jgi:uncharacterized surface protein with fasciclin (FAS1) repeats
MRRGPFLVAAAVASALLLGACEDASDSAATPATTTTAPASPTASASAAAGTIAEVVAGNPDFSTLLAAVEAAGLTETLSGSGPFTVFAPTDDAFAKLAGGTLDTLLEPANKDQLAAILAYHVVPAEVMAADVTTGEVTTANGASFTVAVNGGTIEITDGRGDRASVTQADVEASNGVIHVIDTVLLPQE